MACKVPPTSIELTHWRCSWGTGLPVIPSRMELHHSEHRTLETFHELMSLLRTQEEEIELSLHHSCITNTYFSHWGDKILHKKQHKGEMFVLSCSLRCIGPIFLQENWIQGGSWSTVSSYCTFGYPSVHSKITGHSAGPGQWLKRRWVPIYVQI